MAKARYLVEAHVLEGVRFASSPLRTGASQLAQGHDAGAETVAYHLAQHHEDIPSVSTIWRILRREGLVVAQRQKRPRSSLSRFQAELPNELWQADITAWQPASGEVVEILNQIDDHSRLFLGSDAYLRVKAPDVVESFHKAAELHGLPASPLSDNGPSSPAPTAAARCCSSTSSRADVVFKNSRPYKIGLGRAHKGRVIKLLNADRCIRVIDLEGELIRELTLDPSRSYQPIKAC